MDVQHRAASVATLNQAPRLVVQTIEDVLAQTTASRDDRSRPRAALAWQRDLAAACRAALDRPLSLRRRRRRRRPRGGRCLPRAGWGARPLLHRRARLDPRHRGRPWSWKPEARLAGFLPESAAFFERAVAVGDALFPAGGSVDLTLAALAQRGVATVSLGGETAPIQATGEAGALAWPGPSPDRGFAIAFAGGGRRRAAGLGRPVGAAALPRRAAPAGARRRPPLPDRRAADRHARLPRARLRPPVQPRRGPGAHGRPDLSGALIRLPVDHFGSRPDFGHTGAACTSRIWRVTNPRAPACPLAGAIDAPARQARADCEPTVLPGAPRPPRSRAAADEPVSAECAIVAGGEHPVDEPGSRSPCAG